MDEYVRKYNVRTTASMWAVMRRRHGIPRRIVRDITLIPWEVDPLHRHGHAVAMLRAEGRRRAGAPLSSRVAESLSTWLGRLKRDGTVVLYDRSVGWRYVLRRPGVDLDLIREPQGQARRHGEGRDQILSRNWIVYDDGRTVPFDPELLA